MAQNKVALINTQGLFEDGGDVSAQIALSPVSASESVFADSVIKLKHITYKDAYDVASVPGHKADAITVLETRSNSSYDEPTTPGNAIVNLPNSGANGKLLINSKFNLNVENILDLNLDYSETGTPLTGLGTSVRKLRGDITWEHDGVLLSNTYANLTPDANHSQIIVNAYTLQSNGTYTTQNVGTFQGEIESVFPTTEKSYILPLPDDSILVTDIDITAGSLDIYKLTVSGGTVSKTLKHNQASGANTGRIYIDSGSTNKLRITRNSAPTYLYSTNTGETWSGADPGPTGSWVYANGISAASVKHTDVFVDTPSADGIYDVGLSAGWQDAGASLSPGLYVPAGTYIGTLRINGEPAMYGNIDVKVNGVSFGDDPNIITPFPIDIASDEINVEIDATGFTSLKVEGGDNMDMILGESTSEVLITK